MILRHAFSPTDNARLAHLCGALDEHLRHIEQALPVSISRRHEAFRIEGPQEAAGQALALLKSLYDSAAQPIDAQALQLALQQPRALPGGRSEARIVLHTRRADLAARTPNQLQYLRQMLKHDISFGIGRC